MPQGALLRFLDLLKQELDADDARAEVGGHDPDDPCLLWTNLPGGWRLVARFSKPIEDRPRKEAQLQSLIEGFSQTLEDGQLPAPPSPPVDSAFRRLDAALESLRARTGGVGAIIVDVQSPVLWGSSAPHRHDQQGVDVDSLEQVGRALETVRDQGMDLDELMALQPSALLSRLAEVGIDHEQAVLLSDALSDSVHRRDGSAARSDALSDVLSDGEVAKRHHLLMCSAVARARPAAGRDMEPRYVHHEPQFGYFVRSFANIYLLLVVFEGAFSELHVESTVLHGLPGIEALLLSLPPLDPKPKGARVLKFRR